MDVFIIKDYDEDILSVWSSQELADIEVNRLRELYDVVSNRGDYVVYELQVEHTPREIK